MDFFFVDDATQSNPSRGGMNSPLVAIGGIHVQDESVGGIEREIESVCKEYGLPDGEVFKWSPGRDLWIHDNLIENRREEFFIRILNTAKDSGAKAIVVIEDTGYKTAISGARRDVDLINLFLERAHLELSKKGRCGIVIVSQPSGDRAAENKLIADCVETLRFGTDYIKFERFPLSIFSASHKFIRLLQLADIVTSCTTAFVAGESNYSPPIFEVIKQMMPGDSQRKGGIGLKIHPDLQYVNLYHWLLGDTHFWRGSVGLGMPLPNFPYSANPDTQ